MNSKQDIRTLRQRCQNLFLTVTKAKTWKYKFNVEIGRKLWNAFIFRYISGTPRTFWLISDFISLKFGSRLRDVSTRFSIKGLVFEQDELKQHRWEHQISAPVRLERLRARWKIVHTKTNRRTNFQKQAVVASTRKLSLKTRGHVFGNRQMIPLSYKINLLVRFGAPGDLAEGESGRAKRGWAEHGWEGVLTKRG